MCRTTPKIFHTVRHMTPDDGHPRKLNINYSAPIGSIDLAAEEQDGTPYSIWPCSVCLPWHAELIRQGDDVFVREWHAFDCEAFQDLIKRD